MTKQITVRTHMNARADITTTRESVQVAVEGAAIEIVSGTNTITVYDNAVEVIDGSGARKRIELAR